MKKNIIISILIIIVLGTVFITIKNPKNSDSIGNEKYVATKKDYDEAAKVVKGFMDAQNKHDMNLVNHYILDCKESDMSIKHPIKIRLNNINKINFISYTIHDTKYTPNTFTKQNGKKVLYKNGVNISVKYEVDFKIDNQPEYEGINEDTYSLVKDENGQFKIVPTVVG